MNKLGEKAGNLVHGLREHVRLGRSLAETVKGKLRLGAKILKVGGLERFFKSLFRVPEEEKLVKASQCYLSTTDGPIAGLLLVSTNNVSFWSERSLKIPSPNGELLRLHYKVFIPLNKIKTVVQCENMKKQSIKYIQITTLDNYDFWFMGFLNYQKAVKYLQQTLYQAPKK